MTLCVWKFANKAIRIAFYQKQDILGFAAFYVTRRFITAFTRTRHESHILSLINPVHAPIALLEHDSIFTLPSTIILKCYSIVE